MCPYVSNFVSSRVGSSPLAWGALHPPGQQQRHGRFIPTRVGSIPASSPGGRRLSVHPHSRGEHSLAKELSQGAVRFIPTRVGSMPSVLVSPFSAYGSSPLAWGACAPGDRKQTRGRFIPTRVGSIGADEGARNRGTVHPHSRGEHGQLQVELFGQAGSSPLAWGALELGQDREAYYRFIPTRVGSIHRSEPAGSRSPVHPHSRGEHEYRVDPADLYAGSSPLAWGACPASGKGYSAGRFIPTRAGSMGIRRRGAGAVPVHPHSRGEHASTSSGTPV